MDAMLPSLIVAGLSAAYQRVIDERYPILCQRICSWFAKHPGWDGSLLLPQNHRYLASLLRDLEREVTQQEARTYDVRADGLRRWRESYLYPLAEDLRLVEVQIGIQIRMWWKQGLFDHIIHARRKPRRPPLATVLQRLSDISAQSHFPAHPEQNLRASNICHDDKAIRRILREWVPGSEFTESQVRMWWKKGLFDPYVPKGITRERPSLESITDLLQPLLRENCEDAALLSVLGEQQICADEEYAQHIVEGRANIRLASISQAWKITKSYCDYSVIGLIIHSPACPCTDDLLWLETQTEHIEALAHDVRGTLADLRADILALYEALQHLDTTATLWKQRPFYELPFSQARQRYQERFNADRCARLNQYFSPARGCTIELSAQINAACLTEGLAGMIDIRCAINPKQPGRTFAMQRVITATRRHLKGIKSSACDQVIQLLDHFNSAARQLERPLPLFALVDEDLFNPHREDMKWMLLNDHELVQEFARRADLSVKTSRTWLSGFARSGGIGLISEKEWDDLVNQYLVDMLYFYKLGRLEDRYPWQQIMARLNDYAALLHLPSMSMQVARAVFGTVSMMKLAFWHGGQGEGITGIAQRGHLVMQDAPRIHAAWILVPVRMMLNLVDEAQARIGTICYAVIVFDIASMRPMGLWVSLHKPEAVEYGLALYQAIWHVGRLDWPLHGIPETIYLPEFLANEKGNDIHRAATWLLAGIEPIESILHWQRHSIIQEIREKAPEALRERIPTRAMTCRRVHDELLVWLREMYLGTQRSEDVPLQCLKRGFAMPAHHSPAAGWLLPPAADQVQTVRNGVVRGNVLYNSPQYHAAPGLLLSYRNFPYHYDGLERGIFVEHAQEVVYLQRSKEIPLP